MASPQDLLEQGKTSELLNLAEEIEGAEGKYWEIYALVLLERTSEIENRLKKYEGDLNSPEWRSKYLFLRAKSLRMNGKYVEAFELIQEALRLFQGEGDEIMYAYAQVEKSIILLKQGKFTVAREVALEAVERFKRESHSHGLAISYNNLGIISHFLGNKADSLSYFEQGLTYITEVGNEFIRTNLMNNLGAIYAFQGKLNKALEYYLQVLEEEKKYKREGNIAIALSNIGLVYWRKGDLRKASEYLTASLIKREKLGVPDAIAMSQNNLAIVYTELGNFERALDYYLRALENTELSGNKIQMSILLTYLIHLLLLMNNREQANYYLQELERIKDEKNNPEIDIYYKFALALYLKWSRRNKDKTNAQKLFEEIIEGDVKSIDLLRKSQKHLVELLLYELKFYGEEEVLNEITLLLDQMLSEAREEGMNSLIVESYLYKSKLSLLYGDLSKAEEYLSMAMSLALEGGMNVLYQQASLELNYLKSGYKELKQYLKEHPSLSDRVDHFKFIELLQMNLGVKIEKPILFMIILESGSCLYAKHLSEDQDINENLVSNFLTAINKFLMEIFSSKGSIEHIVHKDYSLTLKSHENVVYCYVYEGTSYHADTRIHGVIQELEIADIEIAQMHFGIKAEEISVIDRIVEKYLGYQISQ